MDEPRQLMLWETTVTPAGAGRAMVARKPLARRVVTVGEAMRILEPLTGYKDRHFVTNLIRDGRLRASKPAARPRGDGRASNARWMVEAESLAKFVEELCGT
jgi:hypothetical protein